jgi:hypothetical protein
MDRRAFLATSAGALGVTACATPLATPADAASADAALHALLTRQLEVELDHSPQFVTNLGLDTGARAHQRALLDPRSPEAVAERRQRSVTDLAELKRIDPARLGADARLSYDIALFQLENSAAYARKFPYHSQEGWRRNPLRGQPGRRRLRYRAGLPRQPAPDQHQGRRRRLPGAHACVRRGAGRRHRAHPQQRRARRDRARLHPGQVAVPAARPARRFRGREADRPLPRTARRREGAGRLRSARAHHLRRAYPSRADPADRAADVAARPHRPRRRRAPRAQGRSLLRGEPARLHHHQLQRGRYPPHRAGAGRHSSPPASTRC